MKIRGMKVSKYHLIGKQLNIFFHFCLFFDEQTLEKLLNFINGKSLTTPQEKFFEGFHFFVLRRNGNFKPEPV
jgi:hypothetical protein